MKTFVIKKNTSNSSNIRVWSGDDKKCWGWEGKGGNRSAIRLRRRKRQKNHVIVID